MSADRRYLFVIAAAGALLAWYWAKQSAAFDALSASASDALDALDASVYESIGVSLRSWQEVASRQENAQYLMALHSAEKRFDIPRDLLVRLAYQESRFRPDIISGVTVSPAGALGIMQIIPRYHPGVNPLQPFEAIIYAGQYLRRLYNRFGTWREALVAYNWGEGNLSRYGLAAAPPESVSYETQILADVRATGIDIA